MAIINPEKNNGEKSRIKDIRGAFLAAILGFASFISLVEASSPQGGRDEGETPPGICQVYSQDNLSSLISPVEASPPKDSEDEGETPPGICQVYSQDNLSSLIFPVEASQDEGETPPVICQVYPENGIPAVNIRAGAGTDYQVIGQITQDEPGNVVGKTDESNNPWFTVIPKGAETPDPTDDQYGAVTSNGKYVKSDCPPLKELPVVSIPESTLSEQPPASSEVTQPQEIIQPSAELIESFVNALNQAGIAISAEQIKQGLTYKTIPEKNLIVGVAHDGTVLLMAKRDQKGNLRWEQATFTKLWRAYEKHVGFGIKPRHREKYPAYTDFSKFQGGLLALTGALEKGGPVSDAYSFLRSADKNDMAFLMHYLLEPGKFPDGINTENVDGWLDDRLRKMAFVIEQAGNKSSAPVYVVINEPLHGKSSEWNPDPNPLRDKYGDGWLTETIARIVQILTEEKNLQIEKDYAIIVNDDTGLINQGKLGPIHNRLSEARNTIYQRFQKEVPIILGLQVGSNIVPADTIINVANSFADLGGIFLTEVNPYPQDQVKCYSELALLLDKQNIKGLYAWKVVPEPDLDEVDNHPTLFLNSDSTPTYLFYLLLQVF